MYNKIIVNCYTSQFLVLKKKMKETSIMKVPMKEIVEWAKRVGLEIKWKMPCLASRGYYARSAYTLEH